MTRVYTWLRSQDTREIVYTALAVIWVISRVWR